MGSSDSKEEKKNDGVGPESKDSQTPTKNKDDDKRNPLTPPPRPKDKDSNGKSNESGAATEERPRRKTKDLVKDRVDNALDDFDEEDQGGTKVTPKPHDAGAHYDNAPVSNVVGGAAVSNNSFGKKDGGNGVGISQSFAFGDNTGAQTLEEQGEMSTEETATEQLMRKRLSRVRREGVSAEPILPDAAETFTPRVVPKDAADSSQIRVLATKNPLFRSLEPEELETVINAMESETFSAGTEILTEGQMGTNKFYVISKGTVDITRNREFVCDFSEGQTFGELELMYLSVCAATVTCKTALKVYSLDSDTYRHIVMMVSIRKRRLYKELLSNISFLEAMSDYESMQLADALDAKTFEKGEPLLTFGETSEWMYIIVDGEVQVIGRDKEDSSKKVEVCTFTKGDTVGELEFLNHHKAVADVLTTKKTKTCRLHRENFEMCMGPVKDYLKENAETQKYDYYNSVVQDDGEGHMMANFKFGESDSAFCAFAEQSSPESHANADDEDAEGGEGTQKKPKVRRIGVSDEVMEDDDDWQPPVHAKTDEEKDSLRTALKDNLLLRSLEGRDMDIVVDAMEKHQFSAGTLILEQGGDGGEHYYVIVAGVVEILKQGELITTFGAGQGFGEMELMYIQPVVATVRARNDVVTWAIDRGTYKRVVMQLAVKRRQLYSDLLGGVDFLENMSEYEKSTLADALSPATHPPGSYMIRRGERNEWMHIIVEGKVEVMGVDDDDETKRKFICFLERGSCVGELEFLNQHPAVADCIAKDEVRTCKLHRDHFEMCMGPIMDVLRKTVRQDKYEYYNVQLDDIAHGSSAFGASGSGSGLEKAPNVHPRRGRAKAVSAETTQEDLSSYDPPVISKSKEVLDKLQLVVRRCPLFSALQQEDRGIVIGALEQQSVPAGTVITKEGELADENFWYIVSAGKVQLKTEASGVVATYGEGQSFGEIDLMYSTAAQASTEVSEDAELFRLDRRSYQKIVMKVCSERRALYKELLSGVQFLSALTDAEQLVLADALSPVHFSPGEYMIRIGDHNEWMYIIVDGVVEVFGNDSKIVCDLRRGEMVGELEFMHKHAAVADCVAKTHVQACKLHRTHFEMCLGKVGDFIEATTLKPKYSYYQARKKSLADKEQEDA